MTEEVPVSCMSLLVRYGTRGCIGGSLNAVAAVLLCAVRHHGNDSNDTAMQLQM